MTRQISFTRLEQAAAPGLRDRLDRAESTEDVRKIFSEAASLFLSDALGQPGSVRYEDVSLVPDEGDGYELVPSLLEAPAFKDTWEGSDLPRIMATMARGAVNRYHHLDKHPEKTQAKIFHHKQGKR